MTKNEAVAIVVAGGKGLRFGGPVRKQYLRLQGWPLLRWSLVAFDRSPTVTALIVVAPASDEPGLRRMLPRWRLRKPFQIVAGGETRAASVRRGLAALPACCRWVAVHDAVRPLISKETIEATFRAAARHRAAIAATPSKDTVKISDRAQRIRSTPDRQTVWLAQTPQIFERALLDRAHLRGRHLAATDDAQLVERLGVRVRLVHSPAENLKVTLPADLAVARAILRGRAA